MVFEAGGLAGGEGYVILQRTKSQSVGLSWDGGLQVTGSKNSLATKLNRPKRRYKQTKGVTLMQNDELRITPKKINQYFFLISF